MINFNYTLRRKFLRVYPPEGSFSSKNFYDYRKVNNNLFLLSSFLGLPNQTPKYEDMPTWAVIAKNFIGWRGGWFYKLFMPFVTIYNLISVLVGAPLNFLRLVTEILPFIFIIIGEDFAQADEGSLYHIGGSLLQWIFHPLLFLGQAITSPAAAVVMYWDAFHYSRGLKAVGYFSLMILSLLVTTTVYSLIFPLAIKALAATILPALPNILTGVMGVLLPAFKAIGTGIITALFGLSMPAVSSALMPLAAYIGFTAINTLAFTIYLSAWEIIDRKLLTSMTFKRLVMSIGFKPDIEVKPVDNAEGKLNASYSTMFQTGVSGVNDQMEYDIDSQIAPNKFSKDSIIPDLDSDWKPEDTPYIENDSINLSNSFS